MTEHSRSSCLPQSMALPLDATSQSVSTYFAEDILFEVAIIAKHNSFRGTLFVFGIANVGQLDATQIVCDLEEIIVCRGNVSIDYDVFRKHLLNSAMNYIVDNNLTIVIVDLDNVVLLKLSQVLYQCEVNVLTHSIFKLTSIAKYLFAITQCYIAKWHLFNKYAKLRKITLSLMRVKNVIWTLPVSDGGEVKSKVWQPCIIQRLFETLDISLNVVCLDVKYQGEQIILGASSDVSGFIDEDGRLFHLVSLQNKKCRRETSGSLTGPLSKVRHLHSTHWLPRASCRVPLQPDFGAMPLVLGIVACSSCCLTVARAKSRACTAKSRYMYDFPHATSRRRVPCAPLTCGFAARMPWRPAVSVTCARQNRTHSGIPRARRSGCAHRAVGTLLTRVRLSR